MCCLLPIFPYTRVSLYDNLPISKINELKNDKLFCFIQNSNLNILPKFFKTYLYIITCNSIFMKIFIHQLLINQLIIKLTLFTPNKILLYFLFKYFYLLLWKIVYLLLINIYLFIKIVSTLYIDHTSSTSNLLNFSI